MKRRRTILVGLATLTAFCACRDLRHAQAATSGTDSGAAGTTTTPGPAATGKIDVETWSAGLALRDFSDAYDDVPQVAAAKGASVLSPTLIAWLDDAKNPLDLRVAVVGALAYGKVKDGQMTFLEGALHFKPGDDLGEMENSGKVRTDEMVILACLNMVDDRLRVDLEGTDKKEWDLMWLPELEMARKALPASELVALLDVTGRIAYLSAEDNGYLFGCWNTEMLSTAQPVGAKLDLRKAGADALTSSLSLFTDCD
jgi:hypothetical protein